MEYEIVIGLEVHVELLTKTKLFCRCANMFGKEPNSRVCPVCLGLPGSLPVINGEAVRKHVLAAMALECRIPPRSKFDRKNYFYPDMPKDYQISQYDQPLAEKGRLLIEGEDGRLRHIGITRIHLEEDTGKSIHKGKSGSITDSDYTLLDYNRAGVPLMEIVSEPDMRSPEEAFRYLSALKKILTWIEVSDCRMEEGSLRCDANISLRPFGSETLGTKTEIKNMNSFRAVRSALIFEVERQRDLLNRGERILQETRGWEADRNITVSMRSKEEAHDYRYFPEPDLPPLNLSDDFIGDIRKMIPELPEARAKRFVSLYQISPADAAVLTSHRRFSDFFEETVEYCSDPKQVANWMMSDVSAHLNRNQLEIGDTRLLPQSLGRMIKMISEGIISGKIAKDLIEDLLTNGGNPDEIVEKRGWRQIDSSDELTAKVKEVLEGNADAVNNYLNGKEGVRGFLVGQVMKATKGKAAPGPVNEILTKMLENLRNNRQEFKM